MYTVKITDRTTRFDQPEKHYEHDVSTTPLLANMLVDDVHMNTADQQCKYEALAQIYSGCASERGFTVLTPERLYVVNREGYPRLRELMQADQSFGLLAEYLRGGRQGVKLVEPAALSMALWEYYKAQCMHNFPDYELASQQHDFVSFGRLATAEIWVRAGCNKVTFLGYTDSETDSDTRAEEFRALEHWQPIAQSGGWYLEVFESEYGRPALWCASMHDEGFSMSMWFVATVEERETDL